MEKNILKKFIVLFSLVLFLFGYNFAFANDEIVTDVGIVSDTIAPVIIIKGINPVELYIGDEYVEEGATATDDVDGDITASMIVVDDIDLNTTGNYTVTYNVSDIAGNKAIELTRIVNVKTPIDTTPEFTVNDITVKDRCTVKDIDGLEHIFPNEASTSKFLGICALVAAKEAGYIDNFELVNDSSLGLYVKSINGVAAAEKEYWALYLDEGYTDCGLGCLPVSVNNILDLVLTNWESNVESTKISLRIIALETVVVEEEEVVLLKEVIVKDNCTIVDTNGLEHIFPNESSTSKFLGICALVAAKEAGYLDSFELVNDPSMGLYLKNINSTVLGASEYWALWVNDDYATCGIGCLPVLVGDKLDFILSDWSLGTESTKISFYVSALETTVVKEEVKEIPVVVPVSSGGGSSGGSSYIPKEEDKIFSISNALNFLSQNKNTDGSFGSPMYTDWAAVAIATGDDSNLKSSISDYLKSNPVSSNVITDYERRAMALMSLGINPYNGTSINYIDKIISSFDGKQIGDPSLYNDDIFGIIVLSNSGYKKNDEIIKNVIAYIISNQSLDGSWGSVDMTSAAIQALSNFKSLNGVNDSISKGEIYLKSKQNTDGGFGNISSTSWAIQALSLNSSFDGEVSKAIDNLTLNQENDGGLNLSDTINNRIWATAYSIPAALKLSWNDILESFDMEEIKTTPDDINTEDLNQVEVKTVELIVEEKIEEVVVLDIKIEDSVVGENYIENKPVKILKKEKIIANIINEDRPEFIKIDNNLLAASSLGAIKNNNIENNFTSLVYKIFNKLSFPFKWLYSKTYVFIASL